MGKHEAGAGSRGGFLGRLGTVGLIWACCLAVSGTAVAQRPLGVDVSKWQGQITLSEWQQARNSGRVFAFIKASQGTIVADEWFTHNFTNARSAGVLVGPYHFADPLNQRQPNEPPHTAVDEANWFVAVAGNYMTAGHLPPVLDLEYGSSLGKVALSTWVNDFCNRVVALKGVRPLIYTNTNYAANYLNSTVAVWDLWIANWGYTNPQTQNPPTGVWPAWRFWQYSSTGSIPGLGSPIDEDVFNGTMSQLQDYLIGDPGQIVLTPPSLSQTIRSGTPVSNQNFTVTIAGGTSLYYELTPDVSWFSVTPTTGLSSGEADPITVSYSTAGLPIGTHTGHVLVSAAGAVNTPQSLAVTLTIEPVPGDLDWDGDIDGQDVVLFTACLTAPASQPGGTLDPGCVPVDYDDDGDVDQSDYGVLQKCISGPTIAADPSCPES